MIIHREGYRTLLWASILVFGVVVVTFWFSEVGIWALFLGLGVLFFFLQFFRYPKPRLRAERNVIYAPAEGKLLQIQEVFEPECLREKCLQLSIFMSPFNAHVNRSPIRAKVLSFRYHPGKYLMAFHPKSSTKNERTSMLLGTKDDQKVLVRQIAGFVARRICYYVKDQDELQAGQEFGFIKFGSRVDIFLPLGTTILVSSGVRTIAGQTPLAKLNPQSSS